MIDLAPGVLAKVGTSARWEYKGSMLRHHPSVAANPGTALRPGYAKCDNHGKDNPRAGPDLKWDGLKERGDATPPGQ